MILSNPESFGRQSGGLSGKGRRGAGQKATPRGAGPNLIKPNTDEIGQLFGTKIESVQELTAAAKILHAQRGRHSVSLGKDGALFACEEGVFRGITPAVPVVNTVDCGDSMLAGFAAAMRRKAPAEAAVRLAMAVSTANALTVETGSFRQEGFERLLGQVQLGRLNA